ncbi:unnamed protein product [Plutella xylostella]|uniref:(diamondback moth) hypothetical protein n=1 Tax=Plutella xylostella TaxID=51655 RepID=A0A8S4FLW4_PLUXY|nr:unnamed protein product [Plutella xylostella]
MRNMEVIGIVGEGAREPWPRGVQPPRLLMQRVHIPFTFKLLEDKPVGASTRRCRHRGLGARSPRPRGVQPPRLLMQRVHIPFTCKLLEDKPVGYDVGYRASTRRCRHRGLGARSPRPRGVQPPRLLMQRVHIPFTCKLLEDKPVGYDGECRATRESRRSRGGGNKEALLPYVSEVQARRL